MFISRLKDKLADYDKYGEHRINGLKVLFVVIVMLIFELVSSLKNPYFYFFFVPLTSFTAEIIGRSLKEKYLFLITAILGASISVFCFGVFSIYKTFFVFFVFFYSSALYYFFIYKHQKMLPLVPLMLGLASYSLIYVNRDVNFYIALNHLLITLYALLVICFALFIFPKYYYYKIWRNAFYDVLVNMAGFCEQLCTEEVKTVKIFSGIIMMERYSKMLPRNLKIYSILKITLLTFELVLSMSYFLSFEKEIRIEYIKTMRKFLLQLCDACKSRRQLVITPQDAKVFSVTHQLQVLYRLILSWNYLCIQR